MIANAFFQNPDFVEYLRLLAQLHALIREGLDETAAGETLRERMDSPGARLSSEEVAAIKGIAADFYSLHDRPSARPEPNSTESLRLRREIRAARDAGRFHEALDRIRACEQYLQPPQIAAMRGDVWSAAGEPAISATFFAWAAKEEPSKESFALLELNQLSKADPVGALDQARRIIADENDTRTALILKAAELVTASTKDMDEEEANPLLQHLAELLEGAAIQLQTDGAESLNPPLYAGLTGLAGICRYRLGDVEAARRLLDSGLTIHPASKALLIARGILQYGRNSREAVEDFQRAIVLGAESVWPLFYLAHYHLKQGRFVECLNMCQQALACDESDESDEIRANLLEWTAICQSAIQGMPMEAIRAVFHEARRLAPENERIRRNAEFFERFVRSAPSIEIGWERPEEAAVRQIGELGYQPLMPAA